MARLVLTVTDAEARIVDRQARGAEMTRAEYLRLRLGLPPPRPKGAPAGNRNNPHGRKGRPGEAR